MGDQVKGQDGVRQKQSGAWLARLVLVCFFFSGMTGLLYEVLWTRMIVKIIGGAPFAISIILTVFMGGLGLGSYIASRRIDRVDDPGKLVRIYGVLELVIGGYCLVLPALLTLFRPIYALVYNQLFGHFMLYSVITFAGCALLLLIPVICMGATLPILCRFYVTRLSHLGGHVGRLYGLNTIGAAGGALICGFWLVNHLGMTGSLVVAVASNVVIGVVSIVAGRAAGGVTGGQAQASGNTTGDDGTVTYEKAAIVGALVIFAVSGFCAMAYEVIWSKLLGLLIGPTTYSFTIVLVTFITGLALGSMIFGWVGDRIKRVIWLLIYTQLAAGLAALLVSQVMGNSQFLFAKVIHHTQDSFVGLNLAKAGVVFGMMLLPTLCLGATFPLVGKIYTQSVAKVGRSVGFAYAINTIGAVLGSFCAGFILVPYLGKENGLRLTAELQIGVALLAGVVVLAANRRELVRFVVVAVVGGTGVWLGTQYPKWDTDALAMGRYHRQDKFVSMLERASWMEALSEGSAILGEHPIGETKYYGDGIAGFTTVLRRDDIFGTEDYSMIISGKPDASSYKDMVTQVLSAHYPLMFHPNPKSVMVLGLASGVTAGEALCYPIERLDVLEISKEVVEASKWFDAWNSKVLGDERTEVIVQDGRAHLQLTERKYDVIISEPSNPWMAGLAALFTQEFFSAAKDRLNEQGIFAQFIHSYQMDWPTFSMVGRTFAAVFENSVLVRTTPGDFLMLGFRGGKGLQLENAKRNLRYAQASKNVVISRAELLYRLLMTEDLGQLCGEGALNTDKWPHLEFSAPKSMYADDRTIDEMIRANRKLKPDARGIIWKMSRDVEMGTDFAAMMLSLNGQVQAGLDLTNATEAQRERYYGFMEEYAGRRTVEYDYIKDKFLKARCRRIQIGKLSGRLAEIPDYNKALAHYTLADLYRNEGLPSEAEEFYRKALEARPEHAELHNDLAVSLHMQGRLPEAVEKYDRALELKPDFPGARSNREKAMARLKGQ